MNAAQALTTEQPPTDLIALAIESRADVGTLERLFALKERNDANIARSAYFTALAAFQSEAPPVTKSKDVMNKDGKTVRYRYAPLDAIKRTLQPFLQKHGFSYSFEPSTNENGSISTTCRLHHVGGHSESATVVIPVFSGFGTNAAQDIGSATQYGMRYAFLGVTGITSADEDDDGQNSGPDTGAQLTRLIQHIATAREWWSSITCIKENILDRGDVSAAAEAYAEMPWPVLCALNVAPRKGGVYTTEERKFLGPDGNKEFHDEVHRRRTDAGWYKREENKQ